MAANPLPIYLALRKKCHLEKMIELSNMDRRVVIVNPLQKSSKGDNLEVVPSMKILACSQHRQPIDNHHALYQIPPQIQVNSIIFSRLNTHIPST